MCYELEQRIRAFSAQRGNFFEFYPIHTFASLFCGFLMKNYPEHSKQLLDIAKRAHGTNFLFEFLPEGAAYKEFAEFVMLSEVQSVRVVNFLDAYEGYTLTNDNVFGAVERLLKAKGFTVKNLIRDIKEDWGDDGGFIVSISTKKNDIYLHILSINYNSDTSIHVLEYDEGWKTGILNDSSPDYIICKDVKEVYDLLKQLSMIVKNFREDYDDEDAELARIAANSPFNIDMLSALYKGGFDDYEKNSQLIARLLTTPYYAQFSDPSAYLDRDGKYKLLSWLN